MSTTQRTPEQKRNLSPVYAYLKNPSMVDYPGHLAAVLFTTGCNFSCGFCHNAELMGKARPGMTWQKLDAGCEHFNANWVDAAVITGGEPTLSAELVPLIHYLKNQGWKVKLDTNGGRPDVIAQCIPLVDYVAMDVKAGRTGYEALTGFKDLQSIEASIALIRDQAADYEFRTTIIDGVHSDDQVDEIVDMIRGAHCYAIQAFVPSDRLPDHHFRSLPRTTRDRLHEIRERVRPDIDHVIIRGEQE